MKHSQAPPKLTTASLKLPLCICLPHLSTYTGLYFGFNITLLLKVGSLLVDLSVFLTFA